MTKPEVEPRWLEDPLPPSCALDIAEATRESGEVMAVTRISRVLNWHVDATEKVWRTIRKRLRAIGVDEIGRGAKRPKR